MDNQLIRTKHFQLLKEKFYATLYPETSPTSLLYLILRKAEVNIAISEQEQDWLESHRLHKTLAVIQLAQYQAQEKQRLEDEFNHLKHQYQIPGYFDLSTSSSLYTILWKLEYEHQVTDNDVQWLFTQHLDEQARLAESVTEFTRLKQQYKVGNIEPFRPDERLYPILKKLEKLEALCEAESEWLLDTGLFDTFDIFKQQEKNRNLHLEFLELKHKYGLDAHPENSTYSFLFSILKRIDANEPLDGDELNWLKQEDLLKLIEINQELKNRQKFEHLKVQYQVNEPEQIPFSEELFELLNAIDAKKCLSDRDIEWPVEYAHWLRFRTLKKKYRLVGPKLPFQPFYDIMVKLEEGRRLDGEQIIQLFHDKYLWRDGLIAKAYHRLEAQFYTEELQRTGNKWNIPSAVSDWRKADELEKALQLSDQLNLKQIKDSKLKAAILTTRGQTLRDMGRLNEARSCAQISVNLQPDDHRPYTLMATILDRMQSYEAQEWWSEAIAHGADPGEQDYEMKRWVRNLKDPQERDKIARSLLKKDPKRYDWAKDYLRD